jgi:hypothetical protein
MVLAFDTVPKFFAVKENTIDRRTRNAMTPRMRPCRSEWRSRVPPAGLILAVEGWREHVSTAFWLAARRIFS